MSDVDGLKYIHTDFKMFKDNRKLMKFTNWRSTMEILDILENSWKRYKRYKNMNTALNMTE